MSFWLQSLNISYVTKTYNLQITCYFSDWQMFSDNHETFSLSLFKVETFIVITQKYSEISYKIEQISIISFENIKYKHNMTEIFNVHARLIKHIYIVFFVFNIKYDIQYFLKRTKFGICISLHIHIFYLL